MSPNTKQTDYTNSVNKPGQATPRHTSPIEENEPDHYRAIQRCSTTTIESKTAS